MRDATVPDLRLHDDGERPAELRELAGDYAIAGELGRGSSAVVYLARDRAQVASAIRNSSEVAKATAEALCARSLRSHPGTAVTVIRPAAIAARLAAAVRISK